jgi:hypothetical protein
LFTRSITGPELRHLLFVARGDLFDIARLNAVHVGDRHEQVGERELVDRLSAALHVLNDLADGRRRDLIGDDHLILVDRSYRDDVARLPRQLQRRGNDLLGLDEERRGFRLALRLKLQLAKVGKRLHARREP